MVLFCVNSESTTWENANESNGKNMDCVAELCESDTGDKIYEPNYLRLRAEEFQRLCRGSRNSSQENIIEGLLVYVENSSNGAPHLNNENWPSWGKQKAQQCQQTAPNHSLTASLNVKYPFQNTGQQRTQINTAQVQQIRGPAGSLVQMYCFITFHSLNMFNCTHKWRNCSRSVF